MAGGSVPSQQTKSGPALPPPVFATPAGAAGAGPAGAPELRELRVLVTTWNLHNLRETSGSLKQLLRSGEQPHDMAAELDPPR